MALPAKLVLYLCEQALDIYKGGTRKTVSYLLYEVIFDNLTPFAAMCRATHYPHRFWHEGGSAPPPQGYTFGGQCSDGGGLVPDL